MRAGQIELRWKNVSTCKIVYAVVSLGNGLYGYNYYHIKRDREILDTLLKDKVVNPGKFMESTAMAKRLKNSVSLGRLANIASITREARQWKATLTVTYKSGPRKVLKANIAH